ncbi:MAG TPA: DMT family transporter [Candidatus Dormibacteraeota bacterium]
MSKGSLIRLGALAVLWGSGFLLIKIALEGMSPIQIVLGRLVAAAVVMLLVVTYRKERLPRRLRPWAHLAVMAVVTNIAPYFLFAWGEQHITSSLAGVLNATTPLFTLLLAVGTQTERLTVPRLAGLTLGFVGVVILAAPWHDGGLSSSLLGIGAALLASACYAASYVYARRFLSGGELSPLVLSSGQMIAGAVLLAALAPAIAHEPLALTTSVVSSVVVLGVLGTGVAYVLNYRLIADEGATTASTVTYLLPIVAVLLGLVVLGEPVAWNLAAGALIVLVGVAFSEGRISRRRHAHLSERQAELERAP